MAGSIPQPFIDDLLERIEIVDVVDSRVKLKKTGKNYSACCPFHDEKTPSFTVSPDKQFFYCFGCGASGNSLGFVMDYERINFPEAVESLAKVAGLEVPKEQTKDPHKRAQEEAREKARKSLYSLMEKANDFYQLQLREHPQKHVPVDYLKRRGLSGHIAKDFGIGYAPPGWDNIIKHLATSNENQDRLLEGGMLIHNTDKGRMYDRFRERIMFPIRDSRGRIIAFGGRVLNDEKPKYLNSPETPIFHKGKELYGLYEARQAYRQLPRVLVVEGYMDVVALAQYGIRYGVATLGTACSEEHLIRAFRFTNEVVFCFDGDEAGRKAARRAMENALPVMEDGRQIKFLYLPEGEDPDTLIRQIGEEKFIRLIEGASPLENFLFEELGQHFNTQTMEGRARLCKIAAPMLDQLPRGIYRELMFNQLANRTQLSMEALMTLLNELPTMDSNRAPEHIHDKAPIESNQYSEHEPTPEANIDSESYYASASHASTQHVSSTTPSHRQTNDRADRSNQLSAEELALTLLLFQPNLAQQAQDYEDLRHSQRAAITLLVNLIDLLKQRPDFTSGQILGHWQGTYGADATQTLQLLIAKASRFRHAKELSGETENHTFNPQQEFSDTLEHLAQQQQQQDCETIIQQLNNKPTSDWSDAEKQLYRKAIVARAN
jgi:DNA primase